MGTNEEMVELDEIGPQLASLVQKIGDLPSNNAKDSLARAGKPDELLIEYLIVKHFTRG